MNILILANYDLGLFQFRKELIEELLKSNEICISLPYGALVEPLKEMGCHFIDTTLERRGMNPIKDSELFFKYLKIIKQLKPDLLITYTVKPNIYGGFAARIAGIPYAVNITGLGTAFQEDKLLKILVTGMYKTALRSAKIVFFENVENRQIFLNEHIVKDKQTYLLKGAGVNLEHFRLEEYPPEDANTGFLFIGRVMKEKGIDELFDAMRSLKADGVSCTLDVLGGYEEDYKDKIHQYEKEGWLHYHGYRKDVRPYIANCHCFVLPSWHEGMANTNLECAAMGRPVITSNIHGCKEAVLEDISGFLCEKKNSHSLYECMKRFCSLPYAERVEMGRAGRKHMEKVFDKTDVVRETIGKLI